MLFVDISDIRLARSVVSHRKTTDVPVSTEGWFVVLDSYYPKLFCTLACARLSMVT